MAAILPITIIQQQSVTLVLATVTSVRDQQDAVLVILDSTLMELSAVDVMPLASLAMVQEHLRVPHVPLASI